MFEKRNDPPCPACGCNDCPPIVSRRSAGLRWGQLYQNGQPATDGPQAPATPKRRRCEHCRREFLDATELGKPDEVLVAKLRCPHCRSPRVRVTRTLAGGVRYHRCDDCLLSFKTREV